MRDFVDPRVLMSFALIGEGLLSAAPVSGQRSPGLQDTTLAALPTPLVGAEFLPPSRTFDWRRHQHIDECVGVPVWARSQTLYDSLDLTTAIDVGRHRDSTIDNPWAPTPVKVRALTQICLDHFSVTSVPDFETGSILQLALTTNADTLVRALVTRRLAAVERASVSTRAAVMDTLIEMLMRSPGLSEQPIVMSPSPAHVQLARDIATQLESLGHAAISEQLAAIYRIGGPAYYIRDAQTILTNMKKRWALEHLLTSDEVRNKFGTSADTLDLANQGFAAAVRWYATDSLGWLNTFIRAVHAVPRRIQVPHLVELGAAAAPIGGDYCFAASASATPAMPLSLQGVPSLIIVGSDLDDMGWKRMAILRRLHDDFPTLRLVLVAPLTGVYRGRWLVDHPAEEAKLRYQTLVDSLGLTGSLCLEQRRYQTLANGEALPLVTPMERAYDLDPEENGWYLIDPQGRIVDVSGLNFYQYRQFLQHWTKGGTK